MKSGPQTLGWLRPPGFTARAYLVSRGAEESGEAFLKRAKTAVLSVQAKFRRQKFARQHSLNLPPS